MFDQSLIKRTKQGKILILAMGLMLVGLGPFIYGFRGSVALLLIGMAIVLLGALIGIAVVGCPSCGTRWVWMALKTQSVNQWLFWLMALSKCPRCGYTV